MTVSFDKRTLAERKAYFEKKAQLEAEFRERDAAEALKKTMAEEVSEQNENAEDAAPESNEPKAVDN